MYQGGSKDYLYIFESMLRIFTMLAHREQSICHIENNLFCCSMTKILSTMTKKFMVFFGVFVCFDGIEAENRRALLYRGP